MSVTPDKKAASDLRSRFRVISNRPNPLYLFTLDEIFSFANYLFPKEQRDHAKIMYMAQSFCPEDYDSPKNMKAVFEGSRVVWNDMKLLMPVQLPTHHPAPHHVHEDGSIEYQPGRAGPFRTYYDGSSIQTLNRLAVFSLDHSRQMLTTQCPLGLAFPDYVEQIIGEAYGDYARTDIKRVQQTDAHSAGLLTAFNLAALAGAIAPLKTVDIPSLRAEMLDTLSRYEKARKPYKAPTDALRQDNAPIFDRPYI